MPSSGPDFDAHLEGPHGLAEHSGASRRPRSRGSDLDIPAPYCTTPTDVTKIEPDLKELPLRLFFRQTMDDFDHSKAKHIVK